MREREGKRARERERERERERVGEARKEEREVNTSHTLRLFSPCLFLRSLIHWTVEYNCDEVNDTKGLGTSNKEQMQHFDCPRDIN